MLQFSLMRVEEGAVDLGLKNTALCGLKHYTSGLILVYRWRMILHEYKSNQRKPWGTQVTQKYDISANTEYFNWRGGGWRSPWDYIVFMLDFKKYIIKFMS